MSRSNIISIITIIIIMNVCINSMNNISTIRVNVNNNTNDNNIEKEHDNKENLLLFHVNDITHFMF